MIHYDLLIRSKRGRALSLSEHSLFERQHENKIRFTKHRKKDAISEKGSLLTQAQPAS